LVMFDKYTLSELRWDGLKAHFAEMDIHIPHIWSSAMLYRGKWQLERERWFHEFLIQKPNPTKEELLWFHHHAGDFDPENGLVMNRMNRVKTVSVSQLSIEQNTCKVFLHDLIKEKEFRSEFILSQH